MGKTLCHFGIKGMKWGVRRKGPSKNNYHEPDAELDEILERSLQRSIEKRQKIIDEGKKEASRLMEKSMISKLISSLGNEQATNDACDALKESGLFDDYF